VIQLSGQAELEPLASPQHSEERPQYITAMRWRFDCLF